MFGCVSVDICFHLEKPRSVSSGMKDGSAREGPQYLKL